MLASQIQQNVKRLYIVVWYLSQEQETRLEYLRPYLKKKKIKKGARGKKEEGKK